MNYKDHLARAEYLLKHTYEQSSTESAVLQAEAHTILAQVKKAVWDKNPRDPQLEGLIDEAEYSLDHAWELCYKIEDGLKIAVGKAKLALTYLRSKS